MARGGHGLPKVSLGPVMPYLIHLAGGPSLKWPYGRFRGGTPPGRVAGGHFLPPWTPLAVCLCWLGSPSPALFILFLGVVFIEGCVCVVVVIVSIVVFVEIQLRPTS
jgi:hypothetical protein